MTGLHFAVCHDDPALVAAAEKGAHDRVIESIRLVGRRTSGVLWRHYDSATARAVLAAAVRADVMPADEEATLLAKLDEFAPAILITAEAEYEPAQGFRA